MTQFLKGNGTKQSNDKGRLTDFGKHKSPLPFPASLCNPLFLLPSVSLLRSISHWQERCLFFSNYDETWHYLAEISRSLSVCNYVTTGMKQLVWTFLETISWSLSFSLCLDFWLLLLIKMNSYRLALAILIQMLVFKHLHWDLHWDLHWNHKQNEKHGFQKMLSSFIWINNVDLESDGKTAQWGIGSVSWYISICTADLF